MKYTRADIARQQREQIESFIKKHSLLAPQVGEPLDDALRKRLHDLSMDEFLDSPEFLGNLLWDTNSETDKKICRLFPCHREDLNLIFQFRKSHGIWLVIDIEAIGSGKSFKNGIIGAAILKEIYTAPNFYEKFKMAHGSEVSLIFMGKTATQSKWVTYRKFVPFLKSPFFQKYFPPNINFEKFDKAEKFPDRIQLPRNILIFPGTGHAGSALGYSPYYIGVDEANHLELTADTKRAEGLASGGVYDAAEQICEMGGGRIASRFTMGERIWGLMVMMSDPKYKNDFLERKFEEAKKAKDFYQIDSQRFVGGGMFCIRRSLWEAKPWMFAGPDGKIKTFRFDVDSMTALDD